MKLHSLITSRRPSVSSGAPQQLCCQHGLPKGGNLPGNQGIFNQHLIRWDVRPQRHSTALGLALNPPLCCAWHGVHAGVTHTALSLRPPCKHLQLRAPVRIRTPAAAEHSFCTPKGAFLQHTCAF